MAADAPAHHLLSEAELRDPALAAERSSHDPLAAADGLEPPSLHARLMAGIGAGAIVFIVVAMALLFGLYRLLLGNPGAEPVQVFPAPRLETSINPRNMPSEPEPGPAPLTLRHPPVEPTQDIQRAMQAVAAKGEHAYDALPADSGGNTVR